VRAAADGGRRSAGDRGHGPVRARGRVGWDRCRRLDRRRDGAGAGTMSVAMKAAIDDAVIDELKEILGDENRVLPNISSRVNRTRTPAPFPVHRWADFMPDVAVLPTSAEQVSGVLKLANRLRIPVVPRAGGTGLADGAVPLKGGILVDVKLMNQIKEID